LTARRARRPAAERCLAVGSGPPDWRPSWWADYGQNLETNISDLHARVQAGRYRAKPGRRAYIPKADGRQRPPGIASVEDKIVQRAVVEVLNAIYEVDFRGFSYGFRPAPVRAVPTATPAVARSVSLLWLPTPGRP
jgi:hypothetical protein